jgi:hypothetical protein
MCPYWHPPRPLGQPKKDSKVLFVVWADVPFASNDHGWKGSDFEHSIYKASFPRPDGSQVMLESEMVNPNDVSLTINNITINNIRYDLAAGKLFLVTTRGGQAQVRQLKRDLSGLRPDADSLISDHTRRAALFEKMAKEDADVARFVAAAEENK